MAQGSDTGNSEDAERGRHAGREAVVIAGVEDKGNPEAWASG